MVTVRFFAAAAQAAGSREVQGDWHGWTTAELVARLQSQFPGLARLGSALAVAVNHEYVDLSHRLEDGDEVALIPPVSGGASDSADEGARPSAPFGSPAIGPCLIVSDPISVDAVTAKVVDPTIGAVVTFVGTVREWTHGRRTVYLEYEAYPEMAMVQMQRIGQEIAQQWPGTRVAITHRVGRLEIGEISVVIAVGTPHRDHAFSACRHAIEQLKRIVPIWKKEAWENGEEWVGSQSGPEWMHPELK